jgi:hypothetical protein
MLDGLLNDIDGTFKVKHTNSSQNIIVENFHNPQIGLNIRIKKFT